MKIKHLALAVLLMTLAACHQTDHKEETAKDSPLTGSTSTVVFLIKFIPKFPFNFSISILQT
jgi:hypothetical protein